jgi:hypothetical protein
VRKSLLVIVEEAPVELAELVELLLVPVAAALAVLLAVEVVFLGASAPATAFEAANRCARYACVSCASMIFSLAFLFPLFFLFPFVCHSRRESAFALAFACFILFVIPAGNLRFSLCTIKPIALSPHVQPSAALSCETCVV